MASKGQTHQKREREFARRERRERKQAKKDAQRMAGGTADRAVTTPREDDLETVGGASS